MAREVAALTKVGGIGVPEMLDHNMDSTADKTVPLFFVADWIDGETLADHLKGRPRSLREAIELTIELARIVQRCHGAGIGHRDIKPDNILRSSNGRLVLVDFGISWTRDDDGLHTDVGQELGNRFLRVPDLAAGRDRQDPRIDLVFVVGILFYLLTGKAPRVLADERMRPPHVALEAAIPGAVKSAFEWDQVRRLFDVGFHPSIDFRFQSVDELIDRLDRAIAPPGEGPVTSNLDQEVAAFREMLRSQIDQSVSVIETAWQQHSMTLIGELKTLAAGLGLENERSAYARVTTGKHAEVMFRLGQHYPVAVSCYLNHRLCFEGESRSYATAGFRVYGNDDHPKTDDEGWEIYYRGHAADTELLRQTMLQKAPDLLARLLQHVRLDSEVRLKE